MDTDLLLCLCSKGILEILDVTLKNKTRKMTLKVHEHFKRLNIYLNISNPGGGFEFTLGSCASSYSNKTAINSFRENIPLIKVLPPHFKVLLMVKSM